MSLLGNQLVMFANEVIVLIANNEAFLLLAKIILFLNTYHILKFRWSGMGTRISGSSG